MAVAEPPTKQVACQPLPQLLEPEAYQPNTLPFIPRAELERRSWPAIARFECLPPSCRQRPAHSRLAVLSLPRAFLPALLSAAAAANPLTPL